MRLVYRHGESCERSAHWLRCLIGIVGHPYIPLGCNLFLPGALRSLLSVTYIGPQLNQACVKLRYCWCLAVPPVCARLTQPLHGKTIISLLLLGTHTHI